MSNRQIQAYILLTMILLTVVILTIVNFNSMKAFLIESAEMETKELLDDFSDETNKFTNERVAELELIADHVALLENEQEVLKFLSNQREKMPFFTTIDFITPAGEVLTINDSPYEVEHPESFNRALLGEIVFILGISCE